MKANTLSSELTRVVACQGAVQLAAAVAAMWTTSGRSSNIDSPTINYLFIHDLSAPDDQIDEFAECIRQLANKLEVWQSIHVLKTPDVVRIQGLLRENRCSLQSLLSDQFGIHACDELFVGQNNKSVPTWLREATPDARHTCFGDGIALNFTNAYFRPKDYALSQNHAKWSDKWKHRLRRFLARISGRPKPGNETDDRFHGHCLLLKNLFDQQLAQVKLIDPGMFLEIFDIFAEDFPAKAPATHAALHALAGTPGKNVVLLTSNFSETGRMSLDGELRGYAQLLEKMPSGKGVTLIIKPHPRDSYAKIEQLRQLTEARYDSTLALSDPWTFYLPFESLYAKYLSPRVSPQRTTHVATVSSACISLEHLYGQHCELGFGANLVEQEFTPLWRTLRVVHENDLVRIVQKLRTASARSSRPQRRAA